jgi:putative NIF3 family GTP cyclohydrolase 1 type 2
MESLPGDSAVYVEGDGITKLMFGIDIGTAELLLARDLGCDAVIAHHPAGGTATRDFPRVLERQVELMVEHGVPEAAARRAADPMRNRALMSAHANNHDHVPSVARLLHMPFLNVHLPLDELGRRMMVAAINDHVATLNHDLLAQDAIDALLTLVEFQSARTEIIVPVGGADRPLGKLAVVHGAGTNGGADIATAYYTHGVDTVIYIHCAGDEVAKLRQRSTGNLIVSGHIASDLVGINPYVEQIEARGVEVIRMSGL